MAKRKSKPPSIPTMLVELGRAVELDSDTWTWTWNKRDNWIVSATADGKRIYLFARPKQRVGADNPLCTTPANLKRSERLYEIFNHRDSDEILRGNVTELKERTGRAIHIVYNSDKFGAHRDYIHQFKTRPIVWVDKPNLPKIMALTGGDIRITTRGIEG